MDHSYVYLLYVGAGAFSGFLGGLFGIGGGLVMVPALLAAFALSGIPTQSIVPMALGTSLAGVAFTSFVAARSHFQLGNLPSPFSGRGLAFAGFLAVGVALGTVCATSMPRSAMLAAIGAYQLLVAAWMFRGSFSGADDQDELSGGAGGAHDRIGRKAGAGFFTLAGAVSAIAGTGAATLMIPFFAKSGIPFRKAAALSSFFGCAVGVLGAASYAFFATPPAHLPMSVGYVSVPAFLSLAVGGVFLVRVGTKASMGIAPKTLSRGFCVFLLASGASMLWPVVGPMLAMA